MTSKSLRPITLILLLAGGCSQSVFTYPSGTDAGALDSGLDAGLTDAGRDAGEIDAGEADAGEVDGGGLDAGSADAGSLCATGNELGVGQACTAGGGQCDGFKPSKGEAALCLPDQLSGAKLSICTKLCDADAGTACGANAMCGHDPSSSAGPTFCLPGNVFGVGTPCPGGHSECASNLKANVCSTDLNKQSPLAICTMICFADTECGAGAVCVQDSAHPNVCVPIACAPPGAADGGSGVDAGSSTTDAGADGG